MTFNSRYFCFNYITSFWWKYRLNITILLKDLKEQDKPAPYIHGIEEVGD